MLFLGRKVDQRIYIETQQGRVEVVVMKVERDRVVLGISAPADVAVLRDELADKPSTTVEETGPATELVVTAESTDSNPLSATTGDEGNEVTPMGNQ